MISKFHGAIWARPQYVVIIRKYHDAGEILRYVLTELLADKEFCAVAKVSTGTPGLL